MPKPGIGADRTGDYTISPSLILADGKGSR